MEFTKEQKLFQAIIKEAWENETFKKELVNNPYEAIEKLTGEKIMLPEGKQLVVRDQTSEEVIYINIPAKQTADDVELNEEQLEAIAGGVIGPNGCDDPSLKKITIINPNPDPSPFDPSPEIQF